MGVVVWHLVQAERILLYRWRAGLDWGKKIQRKQQDM